MANTIREFIKNFAKSYLGWLLVIANLAFFLYLLKEILRISELSNIYCDGNAPNFGIVQTSTLFLIYATLNFPASLIESLLSQILFWNYNNPCINYSFNDYPVIFTGKIVLGIICQSIQWFLIGYILEKTLLKDIKKLQSKNR